MTSLITNPTSRSIKFRPRLPLLITILHSYNPIGIVVRRNILVISIINLTESMSMSVIANSIEVKQSILALNHNHKIITSQLPRVVHYLLNNFIILPTVMNNSHTSIICVA